MESSLCHELGGPFLKAPSPSGHAQAQLTPHKRISVASLIVFPQHKIISYGHSWANLKIMRQTKGHLKYLIRTQQPGKRPSDWTPGTWEWGLRRNSHLLFPLTSEPAGGQPGTAGTACHWGGSREDRHRETSPAHTQQSRL